MADLKPTIFCLDALHHGAPGGSDERVGVGQGRHLLGSAEAQTRGLSLQLGVVLGTKWIARVGPNRI